MASVSVLDDDQIESLMLETGDFVNFLATQDEHEAEKIKSMTLPAKLSYLSNYMSFKPEFTENNALRFQQVKIVEVEIMTQPIMAHLAAVLVTWTTFPSQVNRYSPNWLNPWRLLTARSMTRAGLVT